MGYWAAAVAALGYLLGVSQGRSGWPKVLPALLLALAVAPTSLLGAAAFVFCALGDGFLLAKDRYFLHGLGAFLVGHTLFIPTFLARAVGAPRLWLAIGMAALVVGVLGAVLPRLTGVLRFAVPVYAVALAGMVVSAGGVGTLAATGALTFAVSDGLLAVNRFVRPVPRAELLVLSTYYAALLLIGRALLTA